MGFLLSITAFVLILSALSSCVEAALFSLSELKLQEISQKNNKARKLHEIKKNLNRPISAIVILNNIANIAGSSIIGQIASKELGSTLAGVFITLLTLFVILYAEIFPKLLGEKYSLEISLFFTPMIIVLTKTFLPLIILIEKLTKNKKSSSNGISVTEKEIKTLAKLAAEQKKINSFELLLLERIFSLDNLKAKEIMTPRVVITSMIAHKKLIEVEQEILHSQHTRIIIYQKDIDNIVGIVYKNELLTALYKKEKDKKLKSYAHSVEFFQENDTAEKILQFFRKNRKHLVVIQDKHKGTAGVVSLEDVLEIIVGDIVDETDKIPNLNSYAKLMDLVKTHEQKNKK